VDINNISIITFHILSLISFIPYNLTALEKKNDVCVYGPGSGAFSVVKKAVRRSDGLVVAIKCITRAKLSHSEMKNLEREVKIMREFHHPHVLGLIDAFTDEMETISLVTEFVEVHIYLYLFSSSTSSFNLFWHMNHPQPDKYSC
jgi:serine/threonine protein kinase